MGLDSLVIQQPDEAREKPNNYLRIQNILISLSKCFFPPAPLFVTALQMINCSPCNIYTLYWYQISVIPFHQIQTQFSLAYLVIITKF